LNLFRAHYQIPLVSDCSISILVEIEHSVAGYSTYRLISACSISTSVQILQCISIVSLVYVLTATSISLIYRVEYRHSKSNTGKSIRLHSTHFFLEQRNSLFGSVAYIIAVRHTQMFHKLYAKRSFHSIFGKAGRMTSEEVLLELVKSIHMRYAYYTVWF